MTRTIRTVVIPEWVNRRWDDGNDVLLNHPDQLTDDDYLVVPVVSCRLADFRVETVLNS